MAAHIFDIDGTLVDYHTSEWLKGAKETIIKLANANHDIIFITMRGTQDAGTIWSIENTKKTILKDLDDLNIRYTVLFDIQSPRTIHDDSPVFLDQRYKNQPYII
jgi:ribonucleotide monophosphatase NagD (HAD superfamily)